jgi:hypothetical protein
MQLFCDYFFPLFEMRRGTLSFRDLNQIFCLLPIPYSLSPKLGARPRVRTSLFFRILSQYV